MAKEFLRDSSASIRVLQHASLLLTALLLLASSQPVFANITTGTPKGWILRGDSPSKYQTGIDDSMQHDGKPVAYLKSIAPVKSEFGTIMQDLKSDRYVGKRMQLSGWVKCKDVVDAAGLWMRVDGSGKMLQFDNMEKRPIQGTKDWTKYSVVLDVPPSATLVKIGVILVGTGELWASGLELKPVGSDVPSTNILETDTYPLEPVNLDFSQKN